MSEEKTTERNFLSHKEVFALMTCLDKHRGEWADTTLPFAVERLRRELGFSLSEWNVKTAAGNLEPPVTFKEPEAPLAGMAAQNRRVTQLTAEVERLSAEVEGLQKLLADQAAANELAADANARAEQTNRETVTMLQSAVAEWDKVLRMLCRTAAKVDAMGNVVQGHHDRLKRLDRMQTFIPPEALNKIHADVKMPPVKPT